ncbi:MAG: ABC transporter permease, partial [bacterium]
MFKNYFKIAYRNLLKFKAYTLTNVSGLAVGIAATILILLYIQFEISYDKFHEKADSIYRVSIVHKKEGKMELDSPVFTPPMGPAMARDFPEVENFVRITTRRVAYFNYKDRSIKVMGILHADSSFFDIFSFNLTAGNPRTALVEPYSIVLTKTTASQLFGSDNPVGKTIKLDNKDTYQITGVVDVPPANSHIQFTSLISFSTLYKDPNNFMDWNGGNQYIAYVKLVDSASPEDVERKFPDFMWKYINKQYANYGLKLEPYLQPFKEIHLHYNPYSDARRMNLYIFTAIALLILFIACINFINLATTRATKRAKEVGMRKVLGANKQHLIQQFLGESIIISIIALVFALLLVELLFPLYRELLNRNFDWGIQINLLHVGGLLAIILFVGVVAGSYPALYLSSFQPVNSLKGVFKNKANKARARNVLVVLQFAISITLIFCTILINSQLNFVKSK